MTELFVQPPFDPRIRSLRHPLSGGLTRLVRGFMMWDKSVGYPRGYKKAAVIKFLYNPSTVSTSYIMNTSAAQAAVNFPNSGDRGSLRIPLAQQTEFSLLFDRTYELMDTVGHVKDTDLKRIGVDVDVRAVRQFTSMYVDDFGGGSFVKNGQATGVAGELNQGLMQLTPAYLYFSTPDAGIKYYGYIDSWDTTYTHFTTDMIPMRCEVDISFTFLPPPLKNRPGGAARVSRQQYSPVPKDDVRPGLVGGSLQVSSGTQAGGVSGR